MMPTTRTLADVEPRPVSWLWPGRVPLGKLTIVEGDPGLGKSLVVADLAARVTTGACMPDGSVSDLPGPANVVILAAEDDAGDTLRPRMEAAGADLTRVTIWETVIGDDGTERLPALPDDLGLLAGIVRRTAAKLVVVDPFTAFLSGTIDAWKDAEVRRALTPLAVLAADLGVAVILVRHWTKTPAANPLHRGGGSIAITAASRSVLVVAEHPQDETVRVLAAVKANLSARPPSLAFGIELVGDVPVIGWRGEIDLTAKDLAGGGREVSPERAAVLAYVAGRGEPVTADEVAQALGWTHENARAHLSRAARSGQLTRVASGRYSLPLSHVTLSHQSHILSSPVTSVTDVTCDSRERLLSQPRCRCGGVLGPSEREGWLRCRSCRQYVRASDPAL